MLYGKMKCESLCYCVSVMNCALVDGAGFNVREWVVFGVCDIAMCYVSACVSWC